MTVLEAWSHALPVLMTPQCNLPIGFERGAALKTTTDPAEIARCLGELGSLSEDERQSMGARGKDLAVNHFSWSVVSRRMREVYEWALGGCERPSSVLV